MRIKTADTVYGEMEVLDKTQVLVTTFSRVRCIVLVKKYFDSYEQNDKSVNIKYIYAYYT